LLSLIPAGMAETPPATMPAPRTDKSAVLRELSDTSAAGMSRRLGPDYKSLHTTPEDFPTIYVAPDKRFSGASGHYQYGTPSSSGGDFSSTQGQILYVPNSGGIGCDRVTIIEWTNGVFTESPQPPWHGGSWRPDGMTGVWSRVATGGLGQPIAAARGMGGWSNCGLVLTSSGFIGTSGTVTAAATSVAYQFPRNKLPLAISITNKNELALVTVVDTQTMQGQVAVLMLCSSSKGGQFVHEWPDDYPGLPNVAMFTGMKMLGYVDLPGVTFPTSVCAVGNHLPGRLNGKDGNAGLLREWDLKKAGDRESFFKGNNADFSSSAGFAVIGAKYENKAVFLDLQPLFQRVREAYFTSDEEFAKTRKFGNGKLWPPTFEFEPNWKPAVIKTVDVAQPSAVIASLAGGDQACALVASQDGTVTVFSVGGLSTNEAASADTITSVATFKVGRNPTCLTYQKGSRDGFIAACRGDREIDWIKANSSGGSVTRRLRDAHLLDPVAVEMADTHGIETSIISVTDFQGRKLINYRCSELRFVTNGGAKFGMGPAGKDEFECGGAMEFPGYPFALSATNVN